MFLLGILEELGFLENITSDLYPYRFVITPILVLASLGAGYFAYLKGLHLVLLRHRLPTILIGVPVLVVALVVGDYMLSPLWERTRLDEESPIALAATAGSSDSLTSSDSADSESMSEPDTSATSGDTDAMVVQSGQINGTDDFHFGSGDAVIIETSPGEYVLRFENFSVRNGPDLYVYLSEDPDGRSVDEALNLGTLKATDGAFNYEIPAGIDISKIRSAVVWCKQFAVLFAHAEF